MKILIGCLYFFSLTGSEMYVYELAKGLSKLNCDISIVAEHKGGILENMITKENIKVYNFQTLPKNEIFDIIHCQHVPVTERLIGLYPNIPKICSIHSEMFSVENPVLHSSIQKYIAIRPEIKNHIMKKFGIDESLIQVIYNPVDENRFNTNDTTSQNNVLFVGSLDGIRKKTIFDLVVYTKQSNKELWIVGKNMSNYLPILNTYPHVKYFSPTLEIENFVKNCGETAGILLGRTTIEGWLCGKSGWIYDVDENGDILGKKFYEVPLDVKKYYSLNVAREVKDIYLKLQ